MDPMLTPFDGLFRTDTRHGARVFNSGNRWDFDEADLNESAKALFRHLDRLFEILRVPSFVFLSTIELDAEAGRFSYCSRSKKPWRALSSTSILILVMSLPASTASRNMCFNHASSRLMVALAAQAAGRLQWPSQDPHASGAAGRRRDRLPSDWPDRRDARLSGDDPPL
jgi:hypothetical protein